MQPRNLEALRPMIGLVGGLGVGAAVHYYRALALAHDDRTDPLRLVMAHASIERTSNFARQENRRGLAEYLSAFLSQLRDAGATIGVVPAVTPHICIDELNAIAPLPTIDITEVIAGQVRANGWSRVAIFGTRFVIESRLYGRLPGVDVVSLSATDVDSVHAVYTRLAHTGRASEDDTQKVTEVAGRLMGNEGVESILLAGTDFCVMFGDRSAPFPHLDCAQAHIDAILREVRGGAR